MLQVKGQRRGLQSDLLGDDTGRKPRRSLFDQQPKYREAMLMGQRTERCDCFRRLHGPYVITRIIEMSTRSVTLERVRNTTAMFT